MRYLLASAKSKTQAALGRVRTYPVTIIVAEKLAVKMIKHFPGRSIVKKLKMQIDKDQIVHNFTTVDSFNLRWRQNFIKGCLYFVYWL